MNKDLYEIIDAEYKKLEDGGAIEQGLLQHPGFYKAFSDIFFQRVGNAPYTVTINGNSIEVRSEGNYPEATNNIYKGYKNATKSVLSLEKDGSREYLIVNKASASIFVFPGEQYDSVGVEFGITAYEEYGNEYGYSRCSYQRKGLKNENPLMYINNHTFNPNLSFKTATRPHFINLDYSFRGFKWEAETCTRDFTPGIVRQFFSADGKKETSGYGNIGLEHPERLAGNISCFCVDGKRMDGTPCSAQDLEAWKLECSKYYSDRTTDSGYHK